MVIFEKCCIFFLCWREGRKRVIIYRRNGKGYDKCEYVKVN